MEQLDYSKEYYYSLGKVDDELENRISLFESYIGKILKQLNEATNNEITLSEKDMEILKLYVVLQSCRNDNTSPYIIDDESGFYQNNRYLFGVPLVSTQDSAVKLTTLICDEFERIKKLDSSVGYSYDFRFLQGGTINSRICWGLHLVIVNNPELEFIVSETTAVIECTMDGDYLYTYVPVSPKTGLLLVKSKYYYTEELIEYTKARFGRKYGNGYPDPYLSDVIKDSKLIFNGIAKDGKVTLKLINLSKEEIYELNSVIYEDGHKILYSNEKSLEESKLHNPSRRVIVG